MPPEEVKPPSFKVRWNEVTWYSKLGAIIVFLGVIPALSFYIGTQYEEIKISSKTITPISNVSVPVQSNSLPSINQTSSSTVLIGEFTVVVTCNNLNPVGIQVIKNGSTLQTFSINGATSGVQKCPQAEEHDVNFDGHPDFIVLDGTGSGGGSFSYWLFSSSTQQFSCPEGVYGMCTFMNPQFDVGTKTVISRHASGAGLTIIDTYGVQNGKLVLLKTERIEN